VDVVQYLCIGINVSSADAIFSLARSTSPGLTRVCGRRAVLNVGDTAADEGVGAGRGPVPYKPKVCLISRVSLSLSLAPFIGPVFT